MPANVQPYQPPSADHTSDQRGVRPLRISHKLWSMIYWYPLAMISSLYGVWLLAWSQLGHMPRPSIDDPATIGGVFGMAYYLSIIIAVPFPLTFPVGLISAIYIAPWSNTHAAMRRWWLMLATYVLLNMLVFWILHRDPLGVAEWFAD